MCVMEKKRMVFLFIAAVLLSLYIGLEIYGRYSMTGIASWYDKRFLGEKTASGELLDPEKLTAAHRRLDLGILVKVTNMKNNRAVIVKINDRGPYIPGRIIDLSKAAARELDMLEDGLTSVCLEIIKSE